MSCEFSASIDITGRGCKECGRWMTVMSGSKGVWQSRKMSPVHGG